MNIPIFSIVIPVFNRAWSVKRAVDSAISFSNGLILIEIVLVDDASTDNSAEVINGLIEKNRTLVNVSFRYGAHALNRGVCAAKNTGAKLATGEWIIFLDSDDELIPGVAASVYNCLTANAKYPLQFFKCASEFEEVIYVAIATELRNLLNYFASGTDGEALPVVRRNVFIDFLYDEDINGYESLAYFRLVKAHSFAVLHSLIARRYYTSHDSRLSSRSGMARRYRNLAKGHLRVLQEHSSTMNGRIFLKQWMRYVKALALSIAT